MNIFLKQTIIINKEKQINFNKWRLYFVLIVKNNLIIKYYIYLIVVFFIIDVFFHFFECNVELYEFCIYDVWMKIVFFISMFKFVRIFIYDFSDFVCVIVWNLQFSIIFLKFIYFFQFVDFHFSRHKKRELFVYVVFFDFYT